MRLRGSKERELLIDVRGLQNKRARAQPDRSTGGVHREYVYGEIRFQ